MIVAANTRTGMILLAAILFSVSMLAHGADHFVDCVVFEDSIEEFEWAGSRAMESREEIQDIIEAARAVGITEDNVENEMIFSAELALASVVSLTKQCLSRF